MAKSILQDDLSVCWLCGQPASWADPLDKHHVFGGALRSKSEHDGMWVMLHHYKCHESGKHAVQNDRAVRESLQADAQRAWMERHGATIADFRSAYYKNYLDEVG